MPIYIEPGLYVTVKQLPNGPTPRPLESGFSQGNAYRILGMESFSESAEAYFILSNDRDEVWFISNRHFRTLGRFDGSTALRMPLDHLHAYASAAAFTAYTPATMQCSEVSITG